MVTYPVHEPFAFQAARQKKTQAFSPGFSIKSLAIPYFRMANCHTIIGAKRFHFRVRDGIGWFTLAMVTKQTGVVDCFSAIDGLRCVFDAHRWKSVTITTCCSVFLQLLALVSFSPGFLPGSYNTFSN